MIPSCNTSISEDILEFAEDALRTSRGCRRNHYSELLQEELKRITGRRYCLLLSHCTDTLKLSIRLLELCPTRKVLVPSLTWISSASSICLEGYQPLFADVSRTSYCLESSTIASAIHDGKVSAVVGVQLLGNLFDYEIQELCESSSIPLIEDAAESFGAEYITNSGIKNAGGIGTISCLSFHATKLINSFQGGAFLTDDPEIYRRAKLLSHHGIDEQSSGRYYWSVQLGDNFAYSDLQAALAYGHVLNLEKLLLNRKLIFDSYKQLLLDSRYFDLMPDIKRGGQKQPSYWLPTVSLKPEFCGLNIKEVLVQNSVNFGFELRPMFYPLHTMPTFHDYETLDLCNTAFLSDNSFSLPTGNNMIVQQTEEVVSRLHQLIEWALQNLPNV